MNKERKKAFSKLIKHFKTQQATAEALGVKQGSVSGWVRGLHGCSAVIAIRAEKRTNGKIKAEDLCPELRESPAVNPDQLTK